METITVKEVNGYKIEKYANTRGQYFVNIREGKGFREFHTFRTIKAAVEFIKHMGEKSHDFSRVECQLF